ncbi:MAG: hypothetical protein ABIP74_03035 [Candidatus Saccharimonas sp.]
MNGRWKGWIGRLFGRLHRAKSADMKPLPHYTAEETITYILKTAKERGKNRYAGLQIVIGPRDLRPGMVIDAHTMADQIRARAKDYGLVGGRLVGEKFFFEKI